MKIPFVINPATGKLDPLLTLSILAGTACIIKFIMEGVSFNVAGYSFDLGHADPMTYAALLTPILGTHGYLHVRRKREKDDDQQE